MLSIPWRITLTTRLGERKVFQRFRRETREMQVPSWSFIYKMFGPKASMKPFAGSIDLNERKFFVCHWQRFHSPFPLLYRGRVRSEFGSTVVRFWAFPSPGYVFLLSVVWLLTLVHFIGWVTSDERAEPAFAILGFVFLLIAQRVMLDRARAAFGEVLQGNLDAFNIWPEVELPDLMDSFRSGVKGRGDRSRTLVEQCLAFADPILSHAATPPHKLKINGGTALEIDFPTQTASGFDVRVEVKNAKIAVWAGRLANIDCTIRGDISGSVELCWAHVRELLSDNCRLRELHVDERTAWACVDCRDNRGGWVEMDAFACRGSKPSGACVEKCFVNDLMARKS